MIPKCLSSRPWLVVAVAFTGFVAWWVCFINLAIKHAPPEVPMVTRSIHASH